MTDETLATEPVAVESAPVEAVEAAAPVEAKPRAMEDTIRETYRELTEPKSERVRGENGRFLRAELTETAPEVALDAAPEVAPEIAPVEPKPWEAPPNTWKKDTAALFAALPEPVKQEIHRREEDFHKGISQYKDAAAFGHSMFEDIAPHFDAMRQLGGTPKEVVRDVMNAWRSLATGTAEQKRATLLQLANGYGINLAESAPPSYESQAAPEIAPVLQRLQHLESTIQESQRARAEAEHAERVSQAQKFLNDPSREHIDLVFDDMLALVRGGIDPDTAYNKAVWAHPEARAKLLAKQDAERKAREAAEAAAARKAAAVNVQRRGTPPAKPVTGSMDDTIRQTLRNLSG
jgi:hypothetical protein